MPDDADCYARMCDGIVARAQAMARWERMLSARLPSETASEAARNAISTVLSSGAAMEDKRHLWDYLCLCCLSAAAKYTISPKPAIERHPCPMTPRDIGLYRKVIEGDAAAAELYGRWFGRINRYFRRFGCPAGRCTAEEYASVTWMAVVRSAQKERYVPRPEVPFSAWLLALARRSWNDCLKRHGPKRFFCSPVCVNEHASVTKSEKLTFIVSYTAVVRSRPPNAVTFRLDAGDFRKLMDELIPESLERRRELAVQKEAARATRERRAPREQTVKMHKIVYPKKPNSLAGLRDCLSGLLAVHEQTSVAVAVLRGGKAPDKRVFLQIKSSGSQRSYSLLTASEPPVELLSEQDAPVEVEVPEGGEEPRARRQVNVAILLTAIECARNGLRDLPERKRTVSAWARFSRTAKKDIATAHDISVGQAARDTNEVTKILANCLKQAGAESCGPKMIDELLIFIYEKYPDDFPGLRFDNE